MLIIYKTTVKEAISTHNFIDSKFIRRVRMFFLYYSFLLCCQNFNRIYTLTFFFNMMLSFKLFFEDNYDLEKK